MRCAQEGTLYRKHGRFMPDEAHMEGRDASTAPGSAMTPILSSFADDPEMRDLLLFFDDDLTSRVEALRCALAHDDQRQLRTLAHQLAGSARGYGFDSLGDAALLLVAELKLNRRAQTVGDHTTHEESLTRLRECTRELITLCQRALPQTKEAP